MVKGVKGDYSSMIKWYKEVYKYSRHLTQMLEIEISRALSSNDESVSKAAQANFDKVLSTISSGCYSQDVTVAQLCMKTMSAIGSDLNSNIDLLHLSHKWFENTEQGCYTFNYAYKKHQELAEEFVNCIGNFSGDGD